MSKIIVAFALCGSVQIMGMNSILHARNHAEDLAFILSSNKPLTTATAVGSCYSCMVQAIKSHEHVTLYEWILSWCKRKSTIHDDVRQAVWNAAAHSDNIHQFILLLDHFDNAFKVTKAGRSLLFHAVAHMNVGAASVLLARGAEVDERATGGSVYADHTPLMVAVHVKSDKKIKRRIGMVNLLLKYGASVNSWQTDTPLLLAKDKEIASILIDHGAFVDDCDSNEYTIFDADFMSPADHNDPQLKALVKKILIEGSFRAHMKLGICEDYCCMSSEPPRSAEWELLLRQVVEQFNEAKIPREVQALILSYLPHSQNMCSISVLSHIGDQITQKHADFAIEHVSQSVLKRAINEIKAENQKHIFAKRLTDAFTKRRVEALVPLMGKRLQSPVALVEWFVGQCIPEYYLSSYGVSPRLEEDIRSHYLNKLLGPEK